MAADLLATASWTCAPTPAGALDGPAELGAVDGWLPAAVPGTAAGAALRAGLAEAASRDYDGEDWWFRARFEAASAGPHVLDLGGLATLADVWLDGAHLLRSTNMFRSHQLEVDLGAGAHELVIRAAALGPLLAARRPRPRWKSGFVAHQNLRWVRTSTLGRLRGWPVPPAPVGPWRPVTLVARPGVRVVERRLVAACDGPGGTVQAALRLRGPALPAAGRLVVGAEAADVAVVVDGDDGVVEATVRLDAVERWWPHTHGRQPRYPVSLELGDHTIGLGQVGFRTLELDRTGGGVRLLVNGQAVFCRGAVWLPTDPAAMASPPAEAAATLAAARDANLNMVRLPGLAPYESDAFWDACDELGILVWQDCALAFLDPPDDEDFAAELEAELSDNLGRLGGRPSMAILCGSQQVEEAAAMAGVPRDRWTVPLIDKTIPTLASRLLPGVPYVPSNPTGGDLPFQMDTGVSHYFGVGAYLRPVEDARRAGVRFAAECLAFATPPEQGVVEEWGGPAGAGHHPGWKQAVHRDAGRSWDLEDVVAVYTGELFGVDVVRTRYADPERALDLARATVAELAGAAMSEWRRPGSSCDGALVLGLRDLVPGAGWGLLDAAGRPKAPWYVLRRVCAPRAVLVTDEGLNGLRLHVLNDTPAPLRGRVRVELFARGELAVEQAEREVEVAAHDAFVLGAGELFDGFRDVSYAYRFSTPQHDVVVARLLADSGEELSQAVHLPLGPARPLEPDVGLAAVADQGPDGAWTLTITTRRLAQYVAIDVAGFTPADSWFHLAPGATRAVRLVPSNGAPASPSGEVRALNATVRARVTIGTKG